MIYSIITGTGSYIPGKVVKNADFENNVFFESNGTVIAKDNNEIITKFCDITTIQERRHASDDETTSILAYNAAVQAIESSGIDPETLDYIILAHNFGETRPGTNAADYVPCLAARVKHLLKIKNPATVAYDIIFGCPGWVQAMIQANYYLRSGDARRILVIGADILSRISDPHDRDSMIYADGAGATILEAVESDEPVGILTHQTRTDSFLYSKMLFMGSSYNKEADQNETYIKMNGRRLYQYALDTVPTTVKACLDKLNLDIKDINKVFIHQANGKMDDAILERLFALYSISPAPEGVMPMTISKYGNSSVATVPTLYDKVVRGEIDGYSIQKGETVVFASVGAGMSINVIVYKVQ